MQGRKVDGLERSGGRREKNEETHRSRGGRVVEINQKLEKGVCQKKCQKGKTKYSPVVDLDGTNEPRNATNGIQKTPTIVKESLVKPQGRGIGLGVLGVRD